MAIVRTPLIDDDGSGTTGTILNNAWQTGLYNAIDGIGTWTDVPFNAAAFTAASGAWTVTAGQVVTHSYTVIGKTMILFVYVLNSTLSANPTHLMIAAPAGFTYSARQAGTTMLYQNAAINSVGEMLSQAGTIYLLRDLASTPWGGPATVTVLGTAYLNLA